MKPLISVIIPNYNYANYVCKAIDSVLNQTYQNIEIIVVDDGSKDNSLEVLETFGDKIKILRQRNLGVSAARNSGVLYSKGEFLAFLDADDMWLPQKLEKQVKLFLENKKLGLVHVAVQDIDSEGRNLETHLEGLSGEVSQQFLLFKRAVVLGGGSGAMIPRKIFEQIGGFDLRLSTSADWDLYYQISSYHQIAFIGEILLKYRIHDSNMHANIPQMEREMLVGFEKAFDDGKNQAIKKEAYGNLYQVLAGSFFRSNNYSGFIRNTMKTAAYCPSKLWYSFVFPFRRFQRKIRVRNQNNKIF